MNKKDTLKLTADEGNLIINLEGEVSRTFKLKLIDMDYETQRPPELNPPAVVEVESDLLNDSLKDMLLFSEVARYIVNEDYFIAESTGEFGDTSFKYIHGENINGTFESQFACDKLKDIFEASKFSDIVEIQLGNDMPVIFDFKLNSGDGDLKFLLAPRLAAEEE